jgi:sulfur carrier protein ThiS adenylyltransferase
MNIKINGQAFEIVDKVKLPANKDFETRLYARNTPGIQAKIKRAVVAIAGLGGLGSNCALYLARMGVGTLHLVDFDTVDISNLNRQAYRISDLGKKKTDALAAQIREINPFVTLHTDCVKITEANAPTLFAADTIICEAFDNPVAKSMLINTILTKYPEKYIVAASGLAGYGKSNALLTKRITDHFYLCGDGVSAANTGLGLMAARVAICAAQEANKIIELLIDEV